ncbi:YceD family protein [Allocoleopsis franciscana]|uniref:Putative metal-binding protein, possibly nucleic-acid binding protein n=1 Tax=Allocoleopsis franciscana PCC 7113 TaxID=1173027 RepID=K9WP16_9CYAN|nr:YceD family protein [Allocoleopsis franciscana]AFZ21546.1 putative metal-binding protein, possibly nucleic-acid binding protein [Allocoleopsis franciscana PCC 7113]
MEAIHIPWLLKLPEQTEVIQVKECIAGLETLTPVRGRMQVTHQGNYLEVSAQAETIITLTCDRCLQQYNHRLQVDASEMVWLDESADQPDEGPLERETALEDLVETLPPQGYFQPDVWLYEQLCLATPPRQLCDSDCPGIQINDHEPGSAALTDQRWQALANLKKQLPG